MSRHSMAMAVFVVMSMAMGGTSFAQDTPDKTPIVRELYVPFEHLDALLGKQTNRVFLSRQEYEELKKSAKQQPETKLPHHVALLSANYQANLQDGRAIMRGELVIDVLDEGLLAVPLDFVGVGIRLATLDGDPARLAKNDTGKTVLFVEGAGRHELVVESTMPIATDAAQQTLRFGVPIAPSGGMAFSVPGNVEVKSGASIVDRQVDEKLNLTRFQIVPTPGVMSITMSLNNHKTREQNTVMARGVVVAEVTQAYERLHASMSMNVVGGATDELRFIVDDDLEVDRVSCEGLSRWEIEIKDATKQLVVNLRVPATERIVVNVRMDRGRPEMLNWRFPKFEPLAVAGYTAVVGLVTEDRLRVSEIEPKSLLTIDSGVLTGATADSMFAVEPGAPRVHAIAAFYAPSADYGLSAQLKLPTRSFVVNASSVLTVSDRGISLSGSLSLTPENEKLFSFDFLAPQDWNLLWVRDDDESELKFDRYPEATGTRIRVLLPNGIRIDRPQTVFFEAQYTPPTWLDDWETQTIELPSFPVVNARLQEGVIAVGVQDDLLATATLTENLVVVSESEKATHQIGNVPTALAYQYDALDWKAAIELTRAEPRQTARVLSFIRIETESLVVHSELIYLIAEARSRTLLFSLPDSTPSELSISTLDGVDMKETSSSMANGRRLWTVELAEWRTGSIRLAVDFTQPLQSQEPKDAELPIVRAEAVQYQTGALAIEGHSELETTVKQSPRTIDIGELADAEYQVGKRLVGAYGYVADNDRVVIDISRRPIHALPSTLVQRAELVTQVSSQGRCQTAARFLLRTKATLLESRLPQNATLWSVMLDGKPALPQRVGGRLLIVIPANATGPVRDLQLVYETSTTIVRFRGDVEIAAPELFERDDRDEQGQPIPVADMKWQVNLPSGYRATSADGRRIASRQKQSSLKMFFDAIWRLGGGTEAGFMSTDQRRMAHEFSVDVGAEFFGEGRSANLREPAHAPFESSADQSQNAPAALGKQIAVPTLTKGAKKQAWAWEGVRSLAIDLSQADAGERWEILGLGSQTEMRLSMINGRRFGWLAMAIGLLVFLIGLTRTSRSSRFPYLFLVILAAVLVPTLTGWSLELQATQVAILFAVLGLVVYDFLGTLYQSIAKRFFDSKEHESETLATSPVVTSLLAFVISMPFFAGQSYAQQVDPSGGNATTVSSSDQLEKLLQSLQYEKSGRRNPVAVPEDAVLVPYDSNQGDEFSKGDQKLLVPYKTYQRLWELANPDQKLQISNPPVPYAWSDVAYAATLNRSGTLEIVGKLQLEQLVGGNHVIPLPFSGGALEKATLDGKPAKIISVQPAGLLMLHTSGKGTKKIELRLRMKLGKSGGWRIASGRIPSAPACAMTISVDQANTEIRLTGMIDRSDYLTTKPSETLETALAIDGAFSIRWRDKVSQASIDQGLTVASKGVFDVREDAMRLAWQAKFEFRRGRREAFTLIVPKDYLIEKVLGDNLQGWATKPTNRGQQLDIELLKPAVERESLTVILSKQNAIMDTKPVSLSVPRIVVPDAMLQQGRFTVRRSSLLELRSGEPTGLSRIDVPDEGSWFAAHEEAGPLPMSAYQAYRFSHNEFTLPIDAAVLPAKKSVEIQSLVKVSQRETKYETRLQITPNDRPVYHLRIRLPENLQLETPQVPGEFQWAVLDDGGNRRLLEIDMADGQSGAFSVVLQGEFQAVAHAAQRVAPASLSLPKIEVLDSDQQTGAMVVQVDPAYDVRASNLQECDVALLSSVNAWLTGKQKQLARIVIRYTDPNYDGQLVITPRTASVRSMAVTNIKVTDRAVEETIYVEASISSAGISEFVFLLPASLAKARIEAPLIRQKTTTPIDDSDGAAVRVKLELQDSIMGRFAVIIEHDRLLSSGPQSAPIPVIETGETTTRIVTLENASRDELITKDVVSMESIDRVELKKQGRLNRIGGKSSMVFRIQEDQTKANAPRLTYLTKRRETIETSGARIGLAQTWLIVDELGAYRAKQEYRVENRTEPFLEVAMPEGSRLWTVQVAGENVKPSTATRGFVRVPLIKTAEGDLDYPVILKYGGQLKRPGAFSKTSFPFAKTVNINVELSQVRLRLPDEIRWFGFAGTMGRVQNEGDLQAGWLSFRTKQISDLTRMLSSSRGRYSKVRAQYNLKQLESTVEQQNSAFGNMADANENVQLRQQLESNAAALQQAQQQIVEFEKQSGAVASEVDNRFLLSDLFGSQSNGRSLNVASSLGSNFADGRLENKELPQEANASPPPSRFDMAWLSGNKLSLPKSDSKGQNRFGNRSTTRNSVEPAKKEMAKKRRVVPPVQPKPASEIQRPGRDKFTQQQIAGDYQAQAERYSRKLQQQQEGESSNRDRDGQGAMGMSGTAAFGLDAIGGMMSRDVPPTPMLAETAQDETAGMGMGGAMGGGGAVSRPRAGFLASLEVELPVRGREYMFTTPGGDLELSARSILANIEQRTISSLLVLLVAIAVLGVYRVLSTGDRDGSHQTPVSIAFAIVGTVSLVSGVLPIYGAIAILIAITRIISSGSAAGRPTFNKSAAER